MNSKEQVDAARTAALAVPLRDRATLVVGGKDRVSWLNGMLTCDLAKWAPDVACYGLAVARSGKVMVDLVAVADAPGERVVLIVPAANVEPLRQHLDHYLVMEDVELAPETDGFEVWAVHGPRALDALEAARKAGAIGAKLDQTGLGGAIVLAQHDKRAAVEDALATAAALGDTAGWEALRLERAVPVFGVDFDDKTYPQEAQLEKSAVSFDKGCYLGQEVVCMLELRGHVKRKLVPIVLDTGAEPARGTSVTDEAGAQVGEVTSAGTSPTLGKPIALAMIKRAFAEAGTRVLVGGARAEVVERPA